MTELGGALRGLRTAAKLTQEQLAERSGVSVRTIRRLENGSLPDTRLATINQLAAALGVSPSALTPTADANPDPDPTPQPAPAPAPTPAPQPVPRRPFQVHGALEDAARELAREIRRRWRREEDQRQVRDPFQLLVRWRAAPAELVDRWDNIRRLGPGEHAEPLDLGGDLGRDLGRDLGGGPSVDLSGDLPDVARLHRTIPSGRLVILGRAGAGKSMLAVRLVLDLLESGCTQVPVIFALGGWDPTAISLPDWLVGQLLRDHPHLALRSLGGSQSLAEALFHGDAVLPVLDGFDEIAEGLRTAALRELNATSSALVLTSRQDEFAEAVRATGSPLAWAAGIELGDITPDDLAHYLPRTARGANSRSWDEVLDAVKDPESPGGARIAEALSTPLTVALARVLYGDASGPDPAELLDAERFPDTHALEEHLLAGFVPTLYRSRAPERPAPGSGRRRPARSWDADRAGRWLGHLAHGLATHEADRHDLAWWQIGDSLRRGSRTLAIALSTAVCLTVATWLVGGVTPLSPVEVLMLGLLLGPAAGLSFGFAYALTVGRGGRPGPEPSRTRLHLPRPSQRLSRRPSRGLSRGLSGGSAQRRSLPGRPRRPLVTRLVAVLLGGVVMGAGTAVSLTLERCLVYHVSLTAHLVPQVTLINVVFFALVFGLAAPLVFGLLAALEAPLDTSAAATPSALLAANRVEVGRQLLLLAPLLTLAITAVGELVVIALHGALGPMIWGLGGGLEVGAIGGVGGTVAYLLTFTAWGQWLVLVRFWLPVTGRLPWNTAAFLDDAYRRGALRRCGAVYQFRHVRLQHHLARAHRQRDGRFTDADLTAADPTGLVTDRAS